MLTSHDLWVANCKFLSISYGIAILLDCSGVIWPSLFLHLATVPPSPAPSYHGYRFPPEIISYAVWLYHRFCLSFRDAEDLLAQQGITVTYDTIRQWCQTFGVDYARQLRRVRGRMGDTWHLDELFVTSRVGQVSRAEPTPHRAGRAGSSDRASVCWGACSCGSAIDDHPPTCSNAF